MQTQNSGTKSSAICIGCKDCKGMCSALLDMIFVPDTVLHRSVGAG